MTAARRVVPLPLASAVDALRSTVVRGGPWSDGDGRWTLALAGHVHEHLAGPGRGDWTWAGARGTVRGLRAFGRPVAVELTVEEWSADAVELVLRPAGSRLGAAFDDAVDGLLRTMADVLLLAATAAATGTPSVTVPGAERPVERSTSSPAAGVRREGAPVPA